MKADPRQFQRTSIPFSRVPRKLAVDSRRVFDTWEFSSEFVMLRHMGG